MTFKEVLLIDSTTIHLFSDILKGVSRNPKGDRKKKGGLKVHMLIDGIRLFYETNMFFINYGLCGWV